MIARIIPKKNCLEILDQRLLPHRIVYLRALTPDDAAKAIKDMATRGAPLIGCAAAYGYALALNQKAPSGWRELSLRLKKAAAVLKASRPTAVALAYAVDRLHGEAEKFISENCKKCFDKTAYLRLKKLISDEAGAVFGEDVLANKRLSLSGAKLFKRPVNVMTICNAGALATAGIGTALGVIQKAWEKGKIIHVYACETRPYLQGARLTMFELLRNKIPATLITDNMAAHIMKTAGIGAVVAGADRIAANGDTANKIGTYMLAVLARYHKIPFYIAAPVPTIDMKTPDGGKIPIEERSQDEVHKIFGSRISPKGAKARHPAFDVTPAELITAIITENGIISPVTRANVEKITA